MKVIIVTGMSGAGKTNAMDWFEDQGYYCIDNMPPELVKNFVELAAAEGSIDKAAFVVDVRSGKFFRDAEKLFKSLSEMENVEYSILFVEASVETLVRRYNETRRRHPLTGGKATADVIMEEKQQLEVMRKHADYIIDTTNMKVAGLDAELERLINGNDIKRAFNINVSSFGYKYGIPSETDITIDVRFIPNPFYVKSLRKLTGNNKKVQEYVFRSKIANDFVTKMDDLVNTLIPGYVKEGKYHLNIAFGCTGGHHRSVAMANRMAEIFKKEGHRVTLTHRDLDFVQRHKG